MARKIRGPLEGVGNIIRFNWHLYLFAACVIITLFLIRYQYGVAGGAAAIMAVIALIATLVSLIISAYVYDFSGLYKLSWLNGFSINQGERIINIHAGFDETSALLKQKFPQAKLFVADFYDPLKHTEISIRRARKAYPAFPGTKAVSTTHLPILSNSADKIFALLSAHEIRDDAERIAFFEELHRVIKPQGKVFVVEHVRDTANFIAYNMGFFHFHSKAVWMKTFRSAGFELSGSIKVTPFITAFILTKNGTAY